MLTRNVLLTCGIDLACFSSLQALGTMELGGDNPHTSRWGSFLRTIWSHLKSYVDNKPQEETKGRKKIMHQFLPS